MRRTLLAFCTLLSGLSLGLTALAQDFPKVLHDKMSVSPRDNSIITIVNQTAYPVNLSGYFVDLTYVSDSIAPNSYEQIVMVPGQTYARVSMQLPDFTPIVTDSNIFYGGYTYYISTDVANAKMVHISAKKN